MKISSIRLHSFASRSLASLTLVLAFLVGGGVSVAAPITDIVFMIDATASMGGEIAGVKAGFAGFVNDLAIQNVDARYAIVVYGGAPELILDFTSNAALAISRMNEVSIGANAPFQNNHNFNPEAGLEAIRMVLGAAPNSNLVNNNITEDGMLNFRAGARKNLILATDEDSDNPFYAANRFTGQTGTSVNGDTQGEINATAQAVIANGAFLNLLVSHNNFSEIQYGDYIYDVSDANLLNFDPAATLLNLQNNGLGNSLQAQVLSAGLIGRTFNVAGANDPTFVDNFFAAKVQEIVQDPGGGDPVIPEPSTIILFGTGLAGLAAWRMKKAKQA